MEKFEQLDTILTRNNVSQNDMVKWEYYAYGFISTSGKCAREDLPSAVRYAGVFDIREESGETIYSVDGALETVDNDEDDLL